LQDICLQQDSKLCISYFLVALRSAIHPIRTLFFSHLTGPPAIR